MSERKVLELEEIVKAVVDVPPKFVSDLRWRGSEVLGLYMFDPQEVLINTSLIHTEYQLYQTILHEFAHHYEPQQRSEFIIDKIATKTVRDRDVWEYMKGRFGREAKKHNMTKSHRMGAFMGGLPGLMVILAGCTGSTQLMYSRGIDNIPDDRPMQGVRIKQQKENHWVGLDVHYAQTERNTTKSEIKIIGDLTLDKKTEKKEMDFLVSPFLERRLVTWQPHELTGFYANVGAGVRLDVNVASTTYLVNGGVVASDIPKITAEATPFIQPTIGSRIWDVPLEYSMKITMDGEIIPTISTGYSF